MQFLTPGVIAVAVALTIPPLVALYFLKLRRQEMTVSSTFFWKRAIQDLQVNAPFQKIRRNLLMVLQIMVLLLAALALGQPLLQKNERSEKSLVVLIDRSASMNVLEPDGRTRLQRAKSAALQMVEQVGGDFDRAMVIAFNDRARMAAPFTTDRGTLERAIESIEPSDGLSRLREALALAEAHSQSQIVEAEGIPAAPVPTGPPAQAVLFSDGRIEDAASLTPERLVMRFVNVAASDDNVGITSLSARRYYERSDFLDVIAAVQNFGPAEVQLDVELFINGQHRDIKAVTLGPGVAPVDAESFDADAARTIVSFDEVEFADRGVIEVRLSRADALSADNTALATIGKPRDVRVLLVTPGNVLLRKAIAALPVQSEVMSPADYAAATDSRITEAGRSSYDVVIFDGCTSERLPAGSYLFFDQVPPLPGFVLGDVVEGELTFNWDETHPVLRHVNPQNIRILGYRKATLPSTAESLIDAESGTLISLVNHENNRYLICTFGTLTESREALNTTWVTRDEFVIFVYNAVQYLAGSAEVNVESLTRPGDSLAIEAPKGAAEVRVQRPDGISESVAVGSGQMAHYARTDRVGLYTASPTPDEVSTIAVNLFSPEEGLIRPNPEFAIGGEQLKTESTAQLTNVPLWPWALLGVVAFLLLEWAVYSRRILV